MILLLPVTFNIYAVKQDTEVLTKTLDVIWQQGEGVCVLQAITV